MITKYKIRCANFYVALENGTLHLTEVAETNNFQLCHFTEEQTKQILIKSMSNKNWRYDNDWELYLKSIWRVEECTYIC